ncbi:ferritin-like domain-containing protein [Hydrogenophaga sp. PBL-H3]|uniref:ferritin-like domain-containing protein n=1 Tax=Hydrogenophaga sp. PBL-H3 TaxID=434010 RepID=UPI0013201C66|nr:ferritin-like domain-containing protein [Hydrogenophaga sp. PBL-H3]QHE77179.1 ferritin-like domain-containing protein [Hydrogenophaga sp. PBL-H3]QHE81603.1 ferritin-like domain-containing protein [Hydrogenophaga sp. PBL-H3]
MQVPAALSSSPFVSLRAQALQALCTGDPDHKVAATHALFEALRAGHTHLEPAERLTPDATLPLPGRPQRPVLIAPVDVPQRSPFTPEGLAMLLHAVAHIEFNAIDLALDAIWRFPDMPAEFYTDWLQVAHEEAIHFGLLRAHLQSLGHDYGDFAAHNSLWEMCLRTQHDVTARMALVPRTMEARGLDATPPMQARLRKVGTPAAMRAVEILDVILRDEIGHVAVGNRWYGWLCERQGIEPLAHYRQLARAHSAPRLKPPFNEPARLAAGFTDAELAAMHQA